ncbi:MAG: peptide-methionine (R)-S-oxide reductase MsrB [Gammaproteobacteria bacterium]
MKAGNKTEQKALRERIGDQAWQVTQEAGTERPFTGEFWDHFKDGQYRCIVCGNDLFDSGTKFSAHCGWPSFSDIADEGRIETHEDTSHGMRRVEVRCANCHAHLGHVFPDGPGAKGLRYCINSAALDFEAKD